MKITKKLIDKLWKLKNEDIIEVNGKDYRIMDIGTWYKPVLDVMKVKEEGLEFFITEVDSGVTDFLDSEYVLRCINRDIRHNLVETKDGVKPIHKELEKHMKMKKGQKYKVKYDYEKGKTLIYFSTSKEKKLQDVKMVLIDRDTDKKVRLDSLSVK